MPRWNNTRRKKKQKQRKRTGYKTSWRPPADPPPIDPTDYKTTTPTQETKTNG